MPEGSYPSDAWVSISEQLKSSESLVATTALITDIPVPEIAVPEYTVDNKDTEGNYYGTGTGMQGGHFDGRYYYQSFVKYCYNDSESYASTHYVNNAKNIVVIVKYDMIARKVVATSEEMNNLNHVNDITYNSKTNQLVICNGTGNTKTISFLDASTLAFVDFKKLSVDIYAIEYHAETNQYILGIGGTNQFAIANADFTEISEYSGGILAATEYTRQTLCCDDNYVYCLYFGNGTYHSTDLIIVYDWTGNLVTTIEVDFGNQEPENISVVNGALFVGTGKSDKAYFYNISELKIVE